MKILVIPYGGLGNRIRVLSSVYLITKKYSVSEVKIAWLKKKELNCNFDVLFSDLGFSFKLVKGFRLLFIDLFLKHIYINRYSWFYRWFLHLFYDKIVFDEDNESVLNNPKLLLADKTLLATCKAVVPINNLSHIHFNGIIYKKSQPILDKLGNHFVGVHVRRGDHIKVALESPLDNYFKILANEPFEKLFLASDDTEVKKVFQEKFGEKVITRSIALDRNNPEAIVEGLIDMNILSRSSKIIGHPDSSFAVIASMLSHPNVKFISSKSDV